MRSRDTRKCLAVTVSCGRDSRLSRDLSWVAGRGRGEEEERGKRAAEYFFRGGQDGRVGWGGKHLGGSRPMGGCARGARSAVNVCQCAVDVAQCAVNAPPSAVTQHLQSPPPRSLMPATLCPLELSR